MLPFQEELRNITILKGALSFWLYLNIYLVLTLIWGCFQSEWFYAEKKDCSTVEEMDPLDSLDVDKFKRRAARSTD